MTLTTTLASLARRAGIAVAALVAAALLSSCYLPIRYDAEIEVDRRGFYSMIFDGYLAYVPLYQDIVDKKVVPGSAEENAAVERLRTDFIRDSSVSEFTYHKQGVFKLHWEKTGDLLRHKMVTFYRRNAAMLTLKYVSTNGLITMTAGGLSQDQRRQVLEAGLNVTGELRLITDARVGEHNATLVRDVPDRGPGMKMYVWRQENVMTPSPRLVLAPG